MKTLQWLLQIAVTVILLYLAWQQIELDTLGKVLQNADFRPLLLVPFLLVADLWVNSYRIYSLYKFFNVRVKVLKVIWVKLQGMFFSLIFPLVGDAYKIQSFKNIYGASYGKNSVVVLLDRLIYAFALTIILVPVSWLGLLQLPLVIKLALTSLLLLELAILVIVNKPGWHKNWISKLKKIYPRLPDLDADYTARKGFAREVVLNTLVALVRHHIMALIYLCVAFALLQGFAHHYLTFVITVFFIMLSRVIPVSIGGIGLREYIAVVLFPQMGIASETAFSIALIVSTITILQALIGGGSFLGHKLDALFNKKDVRHAKQ